MSRTLPLPTSVKLGLLLALGVVVLGLRFLWAGLEGALWFQGNLGYYFTLAAVTLWLVLLCRVGLTRGWFTWQFWRPHRMPLLLVAGATLFLHLHEPHVLRVYFDEPTHALGALVMHTHKAALMADRSDWVGDQFVLTGFHTSFRQYLFSFLVSVLHDLTGFRPANVFVLNFLLTPLALLGAYFLGLRLAGRMAGMVAVALLGTLPLFAQVATSGSYDLLNVALIAAFALLTLSYLETPAADTTRGALMDLGLATALLLSMARSESILFLLPWAAVVLVGWWRERRASLSLFTALSPLLLLPNLMMNLVLMASEQGLHGGLRAAGAGYFSTDYLPQHVAETVFYLFSFDRDSTNSVLLSAAGLLGFVGLLVRVAGAIRERSLRAADGWLAFLGAYVAGVYLLVLAQFWSSPTDPAAARFSLPLLLMWAVLGGWLLVQLRWLRERPLLAAVGLLVWGVVSAAPAMARATRTGSITMSRSEEWFVGFAGRNGRERSLYLERSNYPLMANRFASSDLHHLNTSPEVFVRAIKAGLYREAIVFQRLEADPVNGRWRYSAGEGTTAGIVLETLDERILSPLSKARISRFVGYKKADGTLVTPASSDPAVEIRTAFRDSGECHAYRLSLYPGFAPDE